MIETPAPPPFALVNDSLHVGMTMNAEAAIIANGLGRDFGTTRVLRDVSMSVAPGRVCALLGPNGAGKTTLLKLLMGLIEPTYGNATLLDHSCWPPARPPVQVPPPQGRHSQ